MVAHVCADLGLAHETLRWQGWDGRGNLQDHARRARRALLADWARGRGLVVALAHSRDDVAETFLMRLAREAGTAGLAGMRPAFDAEGVRWVRPFLAQTRADLRAYLRQREIGWIDDPSNLDDRFDRVRARKALKALKPLGISVERLTAVVHNIAMTEAALGVGLQRLAGDHLRILSGDVVIAAEGFGQAFGPEMQRRVVNAALVWVSGAAYAPRAAKVKDFLCSWRDRRDRTLHGCRITTSKDEIRITREAKAVAGLRGPVGAVWDRWRLDGPAEAGLEIAALGAEGLKQAKAWRQSGMPRPSLLASPAVWRGEMLVSAPLAGLENGWKAQIAGGSFTDALIRR